MACVQGDADGHHYWIQANWSNPAIVWNSQGFGFQPWGNANQGVIGNYTYYKGNYYFQYHDGAYQGYRVSRSYSNNYTTNFTTYFNTSRSTTTTFGTSKSTTTTYSTSKSTTTTYNTSSSTSRTTTRTTNFYE